MIKKILLVLFLIFIFSINVNAEENDIYKEQLEISKADELSDTLPHNIQEYLEQYSIDLSDYNWVNNIGYQNVFSHIWYFLSGGAKTQLASFGCVLGIILLSAALLGNSGGSINQTVAYVTVISVAALLVAPLLSSINSCVEALKGCAVFISAFVPVFASILAAGGKVATSVSMSALLLGAANGMTYIANYVIVPLISGYLAVSISSSVSPLVNNSGLSESIKKVVFWIISLTSTIFVGILGIQTAVNASADNLSMKTARFIIGSAIPVTGGVLSEALSTLTASISLLKSSVGIYGVIVCCLFFLPILCELLIWRLGLFGTIFVSNIFSLPKLSGLLKAIDTVLSVLIGIILISCAMFVLSLTVVLNNGGSL